MPSQAPTCDRNAVENLEDVDALGSRFANDAAQPDQVAHGFLIGVKHPDNAHKDLREIWLAPDRATAETAIAAFAEKCARKYDNLAD
jgi:hypothetical protein